MPEARFRKRTTEYQTSGVKHFYFMMLQKGEFIDATLKGCLARFCNHSCNPNCYVDKWVVGDKMKMGIFAKRDITSGEEITFDYNVDRYGSEAQPCYCGEANCIGFLGGKTQTEAASKLPQLLVEALELDGSDEDKWMATTKRKRKKKTEDELDEDYGESLPTKPITVASVSKVMSSLLQCREEWLIAKLIARISSTTDNVIHARVMQMHGYQIFSSLLRDWKQTTGIVVQVLQILNQWPKLTKNKISSSKIESTVQELAKESDSDDIKELAKGLLDEWSSLKMAYRIPRRERVKTENGATADASANSSDHSPSNSRRETPNESDNIKKDKKANGRTLNSNNQNNEYTARYDNTGVNNNVNNYKSTKHPRFGSDGIPTGPANKRKSSGSNAPGILLPTTKSMPPGWQRARTAEGRIYYFNREKNLTTWHMPEMPAQYDDDNPDGSRQRSAPDAKAMLAAVDEVARVASAAAGVMGINTELYQRTNQDLTLQKIIEEASRLQDERKAMAEKEKEDERQRMENAKLENAKGQHRKRGESSRRHSDRHDRSNGSSSSKNGHDKVQNSEATMKILTKTVSTFFRLERKRRGEEGVFANINLNSLPSLCLMLWYATKVL